LSISSRGDIRLSELSSRFAVGINGYGPDPSGEKFFVSSWAADGFSSDVTLPIAGAPYRRLAQSVLTPPETAFGFLVMSGFAMKTLTGTKASLGGIVEAAVFNKTLYFQSTVSENSTILPIEQTQIVDSTFFEVIEGPYLQHKGGTDLEASRSFIFRLDNPSFEPLAVLGAGIERWDLDTSPHALPIDFFNSPSQILGFSFTSPFRVPDWLSQTSSIMHTQAVFDLYREGALVGTYPLWQLGVGVSSSAGPHEFRAASEYKIGSASGVSNVLISFDTSQSDSTPPYVTRFRIEQNGIRTPAPFHPGPATPSVKFRVTGSSSVALDWRMNGTTTWTPLPLTITDPTMRR
jgi:hypothetical protein